MPPFIQIRRLGICLVMFTLAGMTGMQAAQADVAPANDGTGTRVRHDGNRIDIDGGRLSPDERNLFHSFERFGLSQSEIANFLSNPNIRNILGRVIGGDASVINGLIRVSGGNSNLYLMNPAGVIFGRHARLDVPGSFTVTTANGIGFGDRWFHAVGTNDYNALVGDPNGFAFTMSQPGAIVNLGDLAVSEGQDLNLFGGTVLNVGRLSAPGGSITVTAVPGENMVRLSQEGMILSLDIPTAIGSDGEAIVNALPFDPLTLPALLTVGSGSNSGLIVMPDQSVQFTDSGTLIPTEPGTTIVSGTVDTSAPSAVGGTVGVFGDRVGLVGAEIDASGGNGGGTVLIGGEYQGQGTVPTADRTFVSADSLVDVDAVNWGNGGQAIVWADETTRFYGTVTARGGERSGDGGFVEISGRENLTFQGTVDLSAPNGRVGTLLLDPENITIVPAGGANDAELLDSTILFTDLPGTTATLSEAALEAIEGDVRLEASNDITITTGVVLDFDGGGTIAFTADADTFNGIPDALGGNFVMEPGSRLNTSGRSLIITAADIVLNGTALIDAGNGDVTFQPSTPTSTIGIGDRTAGENLIVTLTVEGEEPRNSEPLILNGTFNLNTTELTENLESSGTVTIGSPGFTGIGDVYLRNLAALGDEQYNLTVRGGNIRFARLIGDPPPNGSQVILDRLTGNPIPNQNPDSEPIVQLNDDKTAQFISSRSIFESANTEIAISGNNGTVLFDAANNIGPFLNSDNPNQPALNDSLEVGVRNVAARTRNSGFINLGVGSANENNILEAVITFVEVSPGDVVRGITTEGDGSIRLGGGTIIRINQPMIADGFGNIDIGVGEIYLNSSVTSGNGNITLTSGQDRPNQPGINFRPVTIGVNPENANIRGGEITTNGGNISIIGGVAGNQPLNLNAGNGSIQIETIPDDQGFPASINDTADYPPLSSLTINTGSTFTLNNPVAVAGDVSITAADVELNALLDAGGNNVAFQPANPNSTIGLGDSAVGNFNLSTAELTTNLNSSGTVTIGRLDGTGAVQLSNLSNLIGENFDFTVRGGDIRFVGQGTIVQLADNSIARFISSGDISMDSDQVAVVIGGSDGRILLDAATGIGQTGFAGGVGIDVFNVAARTRNSGGIELGRASTPRRTVAIDGVNGIRTAGNGDIELRASSMTIDRPIIADGSGNITLISPGGIFLNDRVRSGSGDITFNTIGQEPSLIRTINIGSGGGLITTNGGNVTFDGRVEGSQVLTLDAGNGTIQFNRPIGIDELNNANPLLGLNIRDAGNVEFNADDISYSDPSNSNASPTGSVLVGARGIRINASDRIDFRGTVETFNDGVFRIIAPNGTIDINALTANGSEIDFGRGNNRPDRIVLGAIDTGGSPFSIVADDSIRVTDRIRTDGGDIRLEADTITTGNLNSSGDTGGDITLRAITEITTGGINSSGSSGDGGNVSLDPSGDIEVRFINAGSESGRGGNIEITTDRFFRATSSFEQGDRSVSIFASGGAGDGEITIEHGGRGLIPFEVGDAEENGTAANIVSGDDVLADRSLRFPYREGNIQILTEATSPESPEDFDSPPNAPLDEAEAEPIPPVMPTIGLQAGTSDLSSLEIEASAEYRQYLGLSQEETRIKTLSQAHRELREVEAETGGVVKPALIYVLFTPLGGTAGEAMTLEQMDAQGNQLERADEQVELILVTSEGAPIRKVVPVTRSQVLDTARKFRELVSAQANTTPEQYLPRAQQLYEWLIQPLEDDLAAQEINTIAFVLDAGLRTLPLAALHDRNVVDDPTDDRFLVENYNIGLMPSLSLTETDYRGVDNAQVLAMGTPDFEQFNLPPLPSVPIEVTEIVENLWRGKSFLNENFTANNLRQEQETNPFGIVHLATHVIVRGGELQNSYIQFADRALGLDQVRSLELNDVELLVLSACNTALEDTEAELGFAGLAVQSGVKSALASLWQVSDVGTLAVMTEFYRQLADSPIKAAALRQAQIRMLSTPVTVEQENQPAAELDLMHPFYWAAFTMVGSPW